MCSWKLNEQNLVHRQFSYFRQVRDRVNYVCDQRVHQLEYFNFYYLQSRVHLCTIK